MNIDSQPTAETFKISKTAKPPDSGSEATTQSLTKKFRISTFLKYALAIVGISIFAIVLYQIFAHITIDFSANAPPPVGK